jgi:hypothetical protein
MVVLEEPAKNFFSTNFAGFCQFKAAVFILFFIVVIFSSLGPPKLRGFANLMQQFLFYLIL